MEVRVLLCKRVLGRLPYENGESDGDVAFLGSWLSTHEQKAVVLLQDWTEFVREWETAIGDFPESKRAFFGILRGIVTPYRDKYAVELEAHPGPETTAHLSELEAMDVITRRHYDTCEFLVTYQPEVFRGKGLVLPDDQIVAPALFRARKQAEADGASARSPPS